MLGRLAMSVQSCRFSHVFARINQQPVCFPEIRCHLSLIIWRHPPRFEPQDLALHMFSWKRVPRRKAPLRPLLQLEFLLDLAYQKILWTELGAILLVWILQPLALSVHWSKPVVMLMSWVAQQPSIYPTGSPHQTLPQLLWVQDRRVRREAFQALPDALARKGVRSNSGAPKKSFLALQPLQNGWRVAFGFQEPNQILATASQGVVLLTFLWSMSDAQPESLVQILLDRNSLDLHKCLDSARRTRVTRQFGCC